MRTSLPFAIERGGRRGTCFLRPALFCSDSCRWCSPSITSPRAVSRNSILLVASLLFYSWGQPSGLLILLLSIGVNYLVGRAIDRAHEPEVGAVAAAARHRLQSDVAGGREVHILRAGQHQLGAGLAGHGRDQAEAVRPLARHFLFHISRDLVSGRHPSAPRVGATEHRRTTASTSPCFRSSSRGRSFAIGISPNSCPQGG